jgi:hypothetical protein
MTSHISTGGGAPLFSKRTIAELTDVELTVIEGGSSTACAFITGIPVGIGIVVATAGLFGAGFAAGYYIGSWVGGIINGENGQTVE